MLHAIYFSSKLVVALVKIPSEYEKKIFVLHQIFHMYLLYKTGNRCFRTKFLLSAFSSSQLTFQAKAKYFLQLHAISEQRF